MASVFSFNIVFNLFWNYLKIVKMFKNGTGSPQEPLNYCRIPNLNEHWAYPVGHLLLLNYELIVCIELTWLMLALPTMM